MLLPRSSAPVRLTMADVAKATSGRLLRGSPELPVDRISIDSRSTRAGDLFIAIRGDRFDGHRFVLDALGAGAIGAVVSDASAVPLETAAPRAVVQVADTTRALQALARHVRRASRVPVVAITGSAGKTTTKEVAADLLSLRFQVFRNRATSTIRLACRFRCWSCATVRTSPSWNSG